MVRFVVFFVEKLPVLSDCRVIKEVSFVGMMGWEHSLARWNDDRVRGFVRWNDVRVCSCLLRYKN